MSVLEILLASVGAAAGSVVAIVATRRIVKHVVARIQALRKRIIAVLKGLTTAVAGGGTSLLVERRHGALTRRERILNAPDDFRTVIATGGASLLIERRAAEQVPAPEGRPKKIPG